ncbi:hypothetical protein T439DRAFT_321802 [Meredithblackwellia eburnea MCA 4105]
MNPEPAHFNWTGSSSSSSAEIKHPTGSQPPSALEQSSSTFKVKKRAPRVERACDTCRKRKSRCTGGDPCAECVGANRTCTYEPIKRGPPRTYAESLEQRLEAMEQVLRNIGSSTGMDLGALLDETDDSEKTMALERAVELLEERRRVEPLTPLSMGTDTESPHGTDHHGGCISMPSPVNVAATGTPSATYPSGMPKINREDMSIDNERYAGASSGPAFAKVVLSELMPDKPMIHPDACPSLVDELLLREFTSKSRAAPLPPADLSAALILAYFRHVNNLIPILHRPSFERAIASGMLESEPSFRRLVLAVFALGARFIDDPRLPTSPMIEGADPKTQGHAKGFSFFHAASGEIASHLVTPTLFDIQGSVLCVVWCLGATSPLIAWQRVGFAVRRAVDVGCHSETRTRWSSSPLEDQLRKRAFHALLSFDRCISAQLGRPLAMQDHDSNLTLPLDITDDELDDWNLRGPKSTPPVSGTTPSPMAAFLCYIKLVKITAKTIKNLYGTHRIGDSMKEVSATVSDLDSSLNEWLTTVPEFLRWDPKSVDPMWLSASAMLYSTWYHAQILVHRDFMVPRATPIQHLPSLAICGNAARSSAHLLDTLREKKQLQNLFWLAPLDAGTSAMILTILLIRQGPSGMYNPASAAEADCQKCIAVLNDLAPSTCMAVKIEHGVSRLFNIAAVHNQRLAPKSVSRSIAQEVYLKCAKKKLESGSPVSPLPYEATTIITGADAMNPLFDDPILAMSPIAGFGAPPTPAASGGTVSPEIDFTSQATSITPELDPSLFSTSLGSDQFGFQPQFWDPSAYGTAGSSSNEIDWVSTFGSSFNFDYLNPSYTTD